MKIRKNKSSCYRRVLLGMVAASMLSGMVMIAAFYGVQMQRIRQRAEDVLNQSSEISMLDARRTVAEVRYIYVDSFAADDPDGIEEELLNYYQKHRQEIPLNQVRHFSGKNSDLYFVVQAANEENLSGREVLLYTDVSFPVHTVRTATGILLVAMVLIAAILYYAGYRTVKAWNEKDESMKNFFANASHELKTPLMAIRGYADGIRAGIVEQDKACAVISKETERMTGLVNDILEFSKLDSGVAQPYMAENDVREILYDTVNILEPTAEQRGIRLSVHLPEPLLYRCDEDMLFSVFSNLLTNSLRYAQHEILITAGKQKNTPHLHVRISNDGAVISREDLAHLFERFYKGNGGQTGIGMALSLEYVKLHQGDIEVFVMDGRTVFEIVLP